MTMKVGYMKTLELEPLTGKKLSVIILEKEYDEPLWQFDNIFRPESTSLLKMIERPSMAFGEFLWEIIQRFKPTFITEELGMREEEEILGKNIVAQICKENNLPYYLVDIDEYAKTYLASTLDEKKDLRDKVLKWLARLSKKEDEISQSKIEYLTTYGQYLHYDFEEEVKKVSFSVRESWIVMGILNRAKEVKEDEVVSIHICSPRHIKGITKLLRSLNVEVLSLKIEKKVASIPEKKASRKRLAKLLEPLEIQVLPVINHEPKKLPKILFFLDTDKHPSAFDISLAYDAGFDKVVPYANVSIEDAKTIAQDTIFSRGVKGVKHSCFLIGGSNLKKAEEVLNVIVESMFPPFETSVIIDPRGAYTTAAAVVAKVEHGAKEIGIGNLKGKKTVILAGTGPVGRIIAKLCAKLGSNVNITSRSKKRAEDIAKKISDEGQFKIKGIQAANQEEVYEAINDATIIFTAGKAGLELISKETLMKLKGKKLFADINAVPPPGVAGLKPKHDLFEIATNIYGIGALAIGDLKYRLEQKMLNDAQKSGKRVFDYKYAFQGAKKLLEEPIISSIEIKSPRLTISPKGKF